MKLFLHSLKHLSYLQVCFYQFNIFSLSFKIAKSSSQSKKRLSKIGFMYHYSIINNKKELGYLQLRCVSITFVLLIQI